MAEGGAEGWRSFGAAVQQARERRGWTRADLAKRARVRPELVTRLEAGDRPDLFLSTAIRLADALGMRLDALTGRTQEDLTSERMLAGRCELSRPRPPAS